MTGVNRRRPRAPEGLGKGGKRLWAAILADYDLSPAELAVLRQACLTEDLIARLDAQLAAVVDLVSVGSTGQPKAHALLGAVAEQRRVLDGLIRSLSLPMPDEQTGHRRSPAALQAAQARWRKEGGDRGQMA